MTGLLIRLFVKEHTNTEDRIVRGRYGRMAGIAGICCNILLCVFKLMVGIFGHSMAILADGINNLSDAGSNIISLIGFRLGSRPADKEHPYGHARYEYLAALFVVVLIMAIGMNLAMESIRKIMHPEPIEFSILMMVVLVGSILIKIWMMIFNYKVGRIIDSDTLRATATDSRNDAISTSAVLIAMIISYFTGFNLDGWMGLFVAGFILVSGAMLFKDTLDPLLGKAPDPKLVEEIQKKILSYEGILGAHDLMVHDYGPGRLFATVHVEMAAEVDPIVSHEIVDRIEEDFLNRMQMNLLIHYDPIITRDCDENSLRSEVEKITKKINNKISVHDFRIRPGEDCENLYFDCVIPEDFSMPEEELKSRIQIALSRIHPQYHCNITIDHSFDALPHEA